MKSSKRLNLSDFERSFETGGDPIHISLGSRKVNVVPPVWAVKALNREASRLGVAEQDLIKIWLIDRLDTLLKK